MTWLPLALDHGARADASPPAEPRLALVIGNGSYQTSPLATSVNDAGLIAQTLAQAGFDVTAVTNADAASVGKLFDGFAAKLRAAGANAVAFIYLAGYGVQVDGNNFFVPLEAKISRDIDVPVQAVSLSNFATVLQATPARARIFVYDLARTGPFPTAGLPLAHGLNVTASPSETMTALNAAPGTVAEPDLAPDGVYARALAEMIQMPGLQANAMFQRVRLRVAERTDDGQIPYDAGRVDFAFHPSTAVPVAAMPDAPIVGGMPIGDAFATCISRDTMAAFNEFIRAFPNDPLTTRVRRMLAIRREVLIWSESLQANTPRAYWTYMRRYPRGPHFGDARRKLAQLNVALEPPPRFDIYDYFDLPPPSADELAIIARQQHLGPDTVPVPSVPASLPPPPRAALADNLPPPTAMPETRQAQQDQRPAPTVTPPAPSALPPTPGGTATGLAKTSPIQPPAMPLQTARETAAPKSATPAQTGAPEPLRSQPSAALTSSSPTGGATLGAIPPALRRQASAPTKAAPPSVVAPLVQAPQPSPTLSEPSATAAASPPAASGSNPPARIESAAAPAAKPLPVTVPFAEKPPEGGSASGAAPPTKAPAPIPVPPAIVTARLAPTDAPPSSRGPPNIGPEMLVPSKDLPSGFLPPVQPGNAALPVPPPVSPPMTAAATSGPATVPTLPAPAASDQPSVAPALTPPSTGVDAGTPSVSALQHATSSGAGLPAEPPLPPPRPKMTLVKPQFRMAKAKRRPPVNRRPSVSPNR